VRVVLLGHFLVYPASPFADVVLKDPTTIFLEQLYASHVRPGPLGLDQAHLPAGHAQQELSQVQKAHLPAGLVLLGPTPAQV